MFERIRTHSVVPISSSSLHTSFHTQIFLTLQISSKLTAKKDNIFSLSSSSIAKILSDLRSSSIHIHVDQKLKSFNLIFHGEGEFAHTRAKSGHLRSRWPKSTQISHFTCHRDKPHNFGICRYNILKKPPKIWIIRGS